jgi:hypothetical protein
MKHYYIYYKRDGYWVYERTCGTKESAKERVAYLKEHYNRNAVWRTKILEGAFY